MESFVSWLDRPFKPRSVQSGHQRSSPGSGSGPRRRKARGVTIRYEGSFGRSVIKTMIVLALLAFTSNAIGERPGPELDANQVASTVGAAINR